MDFTIHALENDKQNVWTHPVTNQYWLGHLSLGVFQGVETSLSVCKCCCAFDEVITLYYDYQVTILFPSNLALIQIPGLDHLRSAPVIASYFSIVFCLGSIVATLFLTLKIDAPGGGNENVEMGVSYRVIMSCTIIVFDYNLDCINQRAFIAIHGSARIVRTLQFTSTGTRFSRVRIANLSW